MLDYFDNSILGCRCSTWYDENCKLTFYHIPFEEISEKPLMEMLKGERIQTKHKGIRKDSIHNYVKHYYWHDKDKFSYLAIPCGFDIETTYYEDDEVTIMYTWQFSIRNYIIQGNTFDEFILLLEMLKSILQLKSGYRLVVPVCNLAYEYQFMKKYLNITNHFFKDIRKPCQVEHDDFIIFQDVLGWGGSLSKLAEDYTDVKKQSGDLNFTIKRTSHEDFSDLIEYRYCAYDVIILSRFMELHWFPNYFEKHYFPLTPTNDIKKQIVKNAKDNDATNLCYCMPRTYAEYNNLLSNVYRGGYVHGNVDVIRKYKDGYIDCIKENIKMLSFDFTSSYPSVMLLNNFVRCYEKLEIYNTYEILYETDFMKNGWYAFFIFKGLKAKTQHSIESVSKCSYLDAITDNGRILYSCEMHVWLSNWDWMNYQEFYEWDDMIVTNVYYGDAEPLPDYVLDIMCKYYTIKSYNKAHGLKYNYEKSLVNCIYGMFVQRRVHEPLFMNDNMQMKKEECIDYNDLYNKVLYNSNGFTKKEYLPTTIGVQISAIARYNLLQTVAKLEKVGCTCLYEDTDSIKFIDNGNGLKIIEDYNNNYIKPRLDAMLKKHNLNYEYFSDLGMFDQEYTGGIVYAKFLGAKRYMITYKDTKKNCLKTICKVSGMKSKPFMECVDKQEPTQEHTKYYKYFNDELYLSKEDSKKTTSQYIDEPKTIIDIKGNVQNVLSCMNIVPIEFDMKIVVDWLNGDLLSDADEFEMKYNMYKIQNRG